MTPDQVEQFNKLFHYQLSPGKEAGPSSADHSETPEPEIDPRNTPVEYLIVLAFPQTFHKKTQTLAYQALYILASLPNVYLLVRLEHDAVGKKSALFEHVDAVVDSQTICDNKVQMGMWFMTAFNSVMDNIPQEWKTSLDVVLFANGISSEVPEFLVQEHTQMVRVIDSVYGLEDLTRNYAATGHRTGVENAYTSKTSRQPLPDTPSQARASRTTAGWTDPTWVSTRRR